MEGCSVFPNLQKPPAPLAGIWPAPAAATTPPTAPANSHISLGNVWLWLSNQMQMQRCLSLAL